MLLAFTMGFIGAGLFTILQGQWLGILFVVIGGGMGLGAMAYVVERLQLILDAQTMTATIRSRTMVRYRQTLLPLADISHAIVETTRGNSVNRGKLMSRPSLVAQSDIYPITSIYSSGNGAAIVVPVINSWLSALSSPQPQPLTHPATAPKRSRNIRKS